MRTSQEIAAELQRVEAEIKAILPAVNEIYDGYDALSRSEAKALRQTEAWQQVERYGDLLRQRAVLIQELEIEQLMEAD